MSRLHHLADSIRSALAVSVFAVLALLTLAMATPARAGEDPYPLPEPALTSGEPYGSAPSAAASAQTIYAETIVNGKTAPRLARLRHGADGLEIHRESAEQIGLRLQQPKEDWHLLASLDQLTFRHIAARGILSLNVAYLEAQRNQLDLANRARVHAQRGEPVAALIIDYDLSATLAAGETSFSAFLETRLVRDTLAFSSAFLVNSSGTNEGTTRLNSMVELSFPQKMTSLTLGDFVSAAPNAARSVRMAGVQMRSNFALQPDLITYPLPDFSGNLAVPSQIDLIVNDARLSTRELEAGGFSLRNIPTAGGRQDIQVVVRDALNRETLISGSTYVSRKLLAPGLREWAVNAGAIRRRFGLASADYGAFAASGLFRQGLSEKVTAGASTELGNGLLSGGLEASTILFNAVELSATARASWFDRQDEDKRNGTSLSLTARSQLRHVAIDLSTRLVSDGFDDLASAGGDPSPRSLGSLSVQFDLGKFGSADATAVHQFGGRNLPGENSRPDTTALRAGWRNQISRALFSASALWQKTGGQSSFGLFFGVSIPLGQSISASLAHNRSRGIRQSSLSIRRPDIVPGDIGFGVDAMTGTVDRVLGQISYLGDWGRVSGEFEHIDGRSAGRANARGSLVFTADRLFATRQSGGGMVLVETRGIPDLVITRENAPEATSREGTQTMLIRGFVPHVPMRIGVEVGSLAPGVRVGNVSKTIMVRGRSVTKVDLGIRAFSPTRLRLRLPDGSAPTPGSRLTALPSGISYLIGFDGLVEVDLGEADQTLALPTGESQVCHFVLPALPEDLADDGEIWGCALPTLLRQPNLVLN